jgi:HAD superfamily phosphatase (TIGR01668 family)
MLKPNAQFEKITDITPDFLVKNNIKAIILDVDNTLIDLNANKIDNIEDWIKKIKDANLKICIASNSLKKDKVKKIATILEIPYIFFSVKPLKNGLKKAKEILGEKSENIAEIGDQLFTDVLGANRMKMFSILTTPIEEEKGFLDKLKRKIERKVLSKKHKN